MLSYTIISFPRLQLDRCSALPRSTMGQKKKKIVHGELWSFLSLGTFVKIIVLQQNVCIDPGLLARCGETAVVERSRGIA